MENNNRKIAALLTIQINQQRQEVCSTYNCQGQMNKHRNFLQHLQLLRTNKQTRALFVALTTVKDKLTNKGTFCSSYNC